MDPAIEDRPLREIRLVVYRKLMKEGKFRPMTWAAAFCKETGGTYRVNGKHTSFLCCEFNLKEIPPLYAIVEYYECDTLKDVAELYNTFDSKTQMRTVQDINIAFKSTIPALEHVANNLLGLCITGMHYSQLQGDYTRIPAQERAEAMYDHHDFILWVDSILPKQLTQLKKMAVIAAMYLTWQRAPRIATEFWTMVRDENAAKPDHPTRKLAKFIWMNSRYAVDKKFRHRVKDREFFVKCLHAWNAYRNDEGTNLNYYAKAPIPDVSK
jgi:hypothetical protein